MSDPAPVPPASDLPLSPPAADAVGPAPLAAPALGSRGWVRWAERLIEGLIYLCGWSAILFVLAIFFFVFIEAAPLAVQGFDFVEFFTSVNWRPTSNVRPQYGTLALLVGSLSVTGLAMLLSVPFGLGAAVYISEFATGKTKEVLKVVVELLAAVPSVVWGFIGMMVLGPIIIRFTGTPVGVNLLNGSVILALMSVPIIVSIAEDALKAVPDSYREAGPLPGREPVGSGLPGVVSRRQERTAGGRAPGRGAGHRRDDGGLDGDRPRDPDSAQPARPGPDADGDHRRRAWGNGAGRHALSRAVSHWVGVVRVDVRGESGGRPDREGYSP